MTAISPLLCKQQVVNATGWCASTLANRVKDGSFPKPVATGPRTRAWLASDVEAYLNARVAERDAAAQAKAKTSAAALPWTRVIPSK